MDIKEIQHTEATDSTHYFPSLEQGYAYLGVALAGEVGEICNMIKKYERGSITADEMQHVIYEEAPDVLIYLVMLADFAGIDLEGAYRDKKEYNERRYRG